MVSEVSANGETNIASKATKQFPNIFPGSLNTKLMKASRWWKTRDTILNDNSPQAATRVQGGVRKRVDRKVIVKGRGRKRDDWRESLHQALLSEFTKNLKAGVQFTGPVLKELAVYVLESSDSELTHGSWDGLSIQTVISKTNNNFVQTFCERFGIIMKVCDFNETLCKNSGFFL